MIKGVTGPVRSNIRDAVPLVFEFNGRGASNGVCPPTQRTDGNTKTKGGSLTRTAAGAYTLVYANGSVPYCCYREGEVMSAAANANVYFVTEATSTGTWTLSILTAAGAAYDPVAADTICLRLWAADAGQP